MAKSERQKLKLLYILKILTEQTDEEHPMPMADLISRLQKEEISAERKSIYSDINNLLDFGVDIVYNPARIGGGYYVASRDFELPELKLLVDAVCASKFITASKSESLIKKIEQLASKNEAVQLQRQVYTVGRIKNENEGIYYHVDMIHSAIHDNRQVTFAYLEWNLEKKLVTRKNGQLYQISPWALLWNDENYYLVGFDHEAQKIKHFRVDKIGKMDVTDTPREGKEYFDKCDLASYSAKTFGMYGGREEIVTMEFPKRLVGVVIDRFGKDVSFQKIAGERFAVHVKVAVSGQFFGWITGIGKEVSITSPLEVKNEYRTYLKEILSQQNDGEA